MGEKLSEFEMRKLVKEIKSRREKIRNYVDWTKSSYDVQGIYHKIMTGEVIE